MSNEQAKSELMQIYGSLSEEKKMALDVLMAQADVTDDDIATMRILFNADIECLCNQGRFNDAKEMEQIRDRLKARLQADGEKNCFNCKWYPDNDITKGFDEVCHKCSNSDKWEGLIKRVPWEDIAPPPKIPEAQADGEKVFKMRDATPEEQEAIDKYIKSISKPTGINIFDFYEDDEKSCNNCKHHLKFMCKNWETCHDYSDWELEELDFVQPKKKIPCTIKVQADGEYITQSAGDEIRQKNYDSISRQAVIEAIYDMESLKYRIDLEKVIKELPSVAIPPEHDGCKDCVYQDNPQDAMPCRECKQNYMDKWKAKANKVGHWIMPQQDDGMSDPIYYQVRCSKCGFDLDPQTWHQELHQYDADKFCPKCGCPMEIER